jgi:hypothetical protein
MREQCLTIVPAQAETASGRDSVEDDADFFNDPRRY